MKKEEQGITRTQAHRVLEDIETVALATKLLNQITDNLGRDILGMMQGNISNKKKEK